MSDYLNNLVARTLNLTPVVEPRLTSLFEPSVAGGIVRPFEPEIVREGLTEREPSQQTSPVAPARAPFAQPRMPISVERGEREVGPKHPPGIESFELREKSKEQIVRRVQGPLLTWPMATPSAPPASNVEIGLLTQQIAAEPNGKTDSDQLQPSASDLPPRVEPASVQPLRPSTPEIIVRQPDSLPIIPTRRVVNEAAEAVEPPPTVSVTIGRIDVRAIFPQPPAPRVSNAQRPAAMSLDEYLKRSEGRR